MPIEKNFLDPSVDGRRTGIALLCLLLAACFPKKKTLFEKNFLDLSVEGRALGRLRCLLRAACFIEEEKLFLGDAHCYAYCLLPVS